MNDAERPVGLLPRVGAVVQGPTEAHGEMGPMGQRGSGTHETSTTHADPVPHPTNQAMYFIDARSGVRWKARGPRAGGGCQSRNVENRLWRFGQARFEAPERDLVDDGTRLQSPEQHPLQVDQ